MRCGTNGEPYRILSLDGGGIRGLLTAVILEQLESRVGRDWIGKADLIAGTSSGGMIALALAKAEGGKGMRPCEARRLFYDRGPIMFEDNLMDELLNVGQAIGAEFSTRGRREVLEDIFGDRVLRDYDQKVLISTVDLHDPKRGFWKAKFFHNFRPVSPNATEPDLGFRASDVALYTTAAPTYFPSVDGFVDGGIVANNPSMAALAQALDARYRDGASGPDEIVLLSVGAGRTLGHVRGEREHDWGFLQWGKKLVDLVSMGLLDVAHYQCKQLLGCRYNRIDYQFQEFEDVGIVDYEGRDRLVEIGERNMEEELDEIGCWIHDWWMPGSLSQGPRAMRAGLRSGKFLGWWLR